MRQQVNQDD